MKNVNDACRAVRALKGAAGMVHVTTIYKENDTEAALTDGAEETRKEMARCGEKINQVRATHMPALLRWIETYQLKQVEDTETHEQCWKKMRSFSHFMRCLTTRNGDKGAGVDRFTLALLQKSTKTGAENVSRGSGGHD